MPWSIFRPGDALLHHCYHHGSCSFLCSYLACLCSACICSGGVTILGNIILFGKPLHSLPCVRLLSTVCQCKASACDDMRRASLMPALVNLMRQRHAGDGNSAQIQKNAKQYLLISLLFILHPDNRLSASSAHLLKAMILSSKANAQASPLTQKNQPKFTFACTGMWHANRVRLLPLLRLFLEPR
jgi:hypothetical protein